MKANELMLFDIVRRVRDKRIITVTGLEYSETISGIAPDDVYYGDQEDYHESELEPIPLTPEILEKNGFKDTDIVVAGTRKFHWRSEDERTEIFIWFDDTMPMEIVKNVYYEDEVSYTLPFPRSVNMLQHALRICGIDKEIVI